MSTAPSNSSISETRVRDRATGILANRFEFVGLAGSFGPALLYSVRYRCGRDAERHRDGSLLLKVLDTGEPVAVELFQAQVRAASMLEHENITPVLESGERNGIHYCLLGCPSTFETLRALTARRGWLSIEDIVASGTILQVANALSHAHAKGVLHLALRADDILIGPSGRVFLTGFGLTRDDLCTRLLSGLTDQIHPLYASPELLSGSAVTELSDIYSLGVILYEMLTDRIPTAMELSSRRSRTALVAPHLIMGEISKEVSAVIMKMLEDDPGNRLGSVPEFQTALISTILTTKRPDPVVETVAGRPVSKSTTEVPPRLDESDPLSLFEQADDVRISNEFHPSDFREPVPVCTQANLRDDNSQRTRLAPDFKQLEQKSRITWSLLVAAVATVLLSAVILLGGRLLGRPNTGPAETGHSPASPELAAARGEAQDRADTSPGDAPRSQQQFAPRPGAKGLSTRATSTGKVRPRIRRSPKRHRRSSVDSHWQPRSSTYGRGPAYYR